MPVRNRFGNWTGFVRAMGLNPLKPSFSTLARENSRIAHKGKRSFSWKGGRVTDKRTGYVLVWKPGHPNAVIGRSKAYVLEHRMVMSDFLKRPLLRSEQVHHKNGDRSDNKIENLELWSTSQPAGQRVRDKLKWAKEFISLYENPELINKHE